MALEDAHSVSDYRHIDFLEHLGPPASVQQSDVLRRRHDDSTWKHGHVRQPDFKVPTPAVSPSLDWSLFALIA